MLATGTSGATVQAKSERTDPQCRVAEVDVTEEDSMVCRIIDQDALPSRFPTHRHQGEFWESLGRTVGTFGFLEQVLGRAIFALSTTTRYDTAEIDSAYEEWSRTLERALTDPLGHLVGDYEKAVRRHPDATTDDLDHLVGELRKATRIRNVLCHGSWQEPDANGASVPLFVDRKLNLFDAAIDCAFLEQVQRHAAELSCAVINSVTRMGWQFPGCSGLGKPII